MTAPRTNSTGVLTVLLLFAFVLVMTRAISATGSIVKSDLKGTWEIEARGVTNCGSVTALVTVTMGTTGTGAATLQNHSHDCGDTTVTGQTFTIKALSAKGAGTATLTCGTGCLMTFNIQVAPDRTKINLVTVGSANAGTFLAGEAVLASSDGNIAVSDLKGNWQVALVGLSIDCGVASAVFNFTLDATGMSNTNTRTIHTTLCGDQTITDGTFNIASLNPDGSGIAAVACGPGCVLNMNIQVSPDRSMFNFGDAAGDTGSFLAGMAVRQSGGGDIVKANGSGAWQLALIGRGACGVTSTLANFTLNTKGASTNVTQVLHSATCGDGTNTGNTFTIETLNADGSGTASLTCGTGCSNTLTFQVSPDRSLVSFADVTPADVNNYWAGTAVHQ